LNHAPRTPIFRKLLTLLVLMAVSALALAPRVNARQPPPCECAPYDGEFCGDNGFTYSSPCVAACGGVEIVHVGPC
jgi:hypothetical protein